MEHVMVENPLQLDSLHNSLPEMVKVGDRWACPANLTILS